MYMKTKSLIISAFTAIAALSACTEDESILGSNGNRLDVSASIPALTRAAIEGTQLPENAQLGVSLFNPDGSDYDGKQQGYKNVLYKSEILTTGGVKWSSANPIILSPSKGKAVAYYPYSAAVADISAIPVETASQTDYLFSDWVSDLSFKNPQANFAMNHALCAVQINLVNADYTAGPGEVTQLSVASPALATTASLNANTGTLSAFTGQGNAITVDKTITLTGESQSTKIIAIPTGTQDNLTVKVVVDGATSTVPVSLNQPFVQGKAYVVNLKVKDAKTPVELVSVTIKEWTEEQLGDFDAPVMDDKYSIEVTIPSNGEAFQSNVYGFTGTIDWGDGTKTSHSNDNNPSHTYANAGKYNVTHRGKCPQLGFFIPEVPDENFTPLIFQYITDILFIGKDLGITNMDGAFFGSGITRLREGIFDNLKNVTSFFFTFMGSKLTSIPQGLFDNCSNVTTFAGTFAESPLQTIPQGLFDNCPNVTTFASTFLYCMSLTHVPRAFDGCTNVTTFYNTFHGCTELTTIAEGLFNNCSKVTTFEGTFYECYSLTAVPLIFEGCTNVTSFENTFYGCHALTSIAEGLFNNCSKVTTFEGTFDACKALTEIPRIFDGCTNVTSFEGTFRDCRALTTIPTGLFNNCTKVTTFTRTFYGCQFLTDVPRIFDGCTNVTSFEGTFDGCLYLPTISQGLFDSCSKVTTFERTFYDCNITNIPQGLFDNCPNVTTFESTFCGCNITNIPQGLFDNCAQVTNFKETFSGCNLTAIPQGLFDNCPNVTTFAMTFRNCSKLSSIPVGLFDNCSNVTTFESTFETCKSLTAVPLIFEECTNATSFEGTFLQCGALRTIADGLFDSCSNTFNSCGSLMAIPQGLFDKCKEVTHFNRTFYNCVNAKGESPYTIINDQKVHLYERKDYPEHFITPNKHSGCFEGCYSLSDYMYTPTGWN